MAYRPTGVYRRNSRSDLAKTDGKNVCAGSIAVSTRSCGEDQACRSGFCQWAFPLIVVKNTQKTDSPHSSEAFGF